MVTINVLDLKLQALVINVTLKFLFYHIGNILVKFSSSPDSLHVCYGKNFNYFKIPKFIFYDVPTVLNIGIVITIGT